MRRKVAAFSSVILILVAHGALAEDTGEYYRYHFGAASCVEAPKGVCVEASLACGYCLSRPKTRVVSDSISIDPEVQVVGTGSARTPTCTRQPLSAKPKSIGSAVWVDSRSEILLVDPVGGAIFLYDIAGRAGATPEHLAVRGKEIETTGRNDLNFILKKYGPDGILTDATLGSVQALINFQHNSNGTKNGLGALYDWTISGKRLFVFGTVKQPQQAGSLRPLSESGFIEADIGDGPWSVNNVSLRLPYEKINYYLLGNRYVAAIGDTAYFVQMGGRAEIWEIGGNPRLIKKLLDVPSNFARIPNLTDWTGPNAAQAVFRELSQYDVPSGLYAFDHDLYLLARSVVKNRFTWWLFAIDDDTGRIRGKVQLPSNAAHLAIVPSPDHWFVFERGPVQVDGSQEISSVLVIKSDWIRGISSKSGDGVIDCSASKKMASALHGQQGADHLVDSALDTVASSSQGRD
jgi:hypothetical protein